MGHRKRRPRCLNRRQLLTSGLFATVATAATPAFAQDRLAGLSIDGLRGSIDATTLGAVPNFAGDQTEVLQNALYAAAGVGNPVFLPPGRYVVNQLILPPGGHLVGVPGATQLVAMGGQSAVTVLGARNVSLTAITVEGLGQPMPDGAGLVELTDAPDAVIRDCLFSEAGENGLVLRKVSGRIENNTIKGCRRAGSFSDDAKGLRITGNTVQDCANNGILVWRSTQGEDGTIVTENRIERIASRDGGEGQNGNGVNVFRAGAVTVANNRITDCAFTAVRANAASTVHIMGNNCARLGEVALYAEFSFEGALIANNIIDDAATGISITNFNDGGRLAVCSGNLIRNLKTRDHYDRRGVGIFAEADTVVNGNIVENAPVMGIGLGWGRYLRDVNATANVVRDAAIGIGVSVAEGAGAALIADNLISSARQGAVLGMDFDRVVTGDLARQADARFPQLTVSRNTVV